MKNRLRYSVYSETKSHNIEFGRIASLYGRFLNLSSGSDWSILVAISICLDDIIDPPGVLYRIWGILYNHIGCFTGCVDVDISVFEDSLKYARSLSVYLLDAIEATLRDATREC
jgi:hypothetical protein